MPPHAHTAIRTAPELKAPAPDPAMTIAACTASTDRHSVAVNYPLLVTRRGCIGIFQALNASLGNLIYNHSQSRSRIQCKTHVFLSPGCDSKCTVSACTRDMNMNMNAIAITYSTVSNACTIFIFNLHSLLITCAN